jgi:glycerate-2-kinase
LLSFFWKQVRGGKSAKLKLQKNVATPLVFHTPGNPNAVLGSGPNTASAGDSGAIAAPDVSVTADALFGADHAQVISYLATKQRADQSRNSALLHHDTVQETLEKVFRSDLSNAKATISRPAMTAAE